MKNVRKTVSDVFVRIKGNQIVIRGNMVLEEGVESTLSKGELDFESSANYFLVKLNYICKIWCPDSSIIELNWDK